MFKVKNWKGSKLLPPVRVIATLTDQVKFTKVKKRGSVSTKINLYFSFLLFDTVLRVKLCD